MTDARPRPIQLMPAAGSRKTPVAAPRTGRPGKNEQPPTIAGFTPYAITSPDHSAHPDKAGRRSAPHIIADQSPPTLREGSGMT
jgi:hypothetical protein